MQDASSRAGTTAAAFLACALAPGAAWAHLIHVVTGDDDPTTSAFVAELLAASPPATTATTTTGGATPSPVDLLAANVVLVAGSAPFLDADAVGDALHAHVLAGGRLVVAAHALDALLGPGGLLDASALVPLQDPTPGAVGALDFATLDPSHPLFAGLVAAAIPDDGQGVPAVAPGAALLASDLAGAPMVASHCGRHLVALNLVPTLAAGDDLVLLVNALFAAADSAGGPSAFAGGDVTVPEGGSLQLDASATIELDGSALAYAWDTDGDLDFADLAGVAPTFSAAGLDGPATLPLALRVTNPCGRQSEDAATVAIANVAPTITALTHDAPRPEGAAVAFAAAATDPGGAADPLTYAWAFGDGTTATGAAATHAYADDGVYTVTLSVADDDGGVATSVTTVTITNAAPVILSLTDDGPRPEASVVSFAAIASDAAGAADPLDFLWAFGDGTTATGAAATHAYPDDGVYTVTLSVADDDGGVATSSTTVTITNAAPVLGALVGPSSASLGAAVSVAASASDVAGPADPLVFAFDWGDGAPQEVGPASQRTHAYAAPGAYTIAVTVSDGDGGTASRSVATQIVDPGPTIALAPLPASVPEGSAFTLGVTAAGPLGGPVTVRWAWGDGGPDDVGVGLVAATHTYGDDGAYALVVTATDAWGVAASVTATVAVDNVAPGYVFAPPAAAMEGTPLVLVASALDPAGAADPLVHALLVGPAGAAVDAASGTLAWTPTYAQAEAGPLAFTLRVEDGDGGIDTASFTLDPAVVDGDGDGLPDTWERANGLDPGTNDAAFDADGDGATNAAEYAAGTDPQASDAPSAPVLLRPEAFAVVGTATPELVVATPADPGGDPVEVEFEVYGDASLGVLLAAGSVPGGAGGVPGETAFTVLAPLPEDATAVWRARAGDGVGFGPYAPLRAFVVDAQNDAPGIPAPLEPVDATVDVLRPPLRLGPTEDPEGDAIAVTVRVRDSGGALLAAIAAEEETDGTWLAVPTAPLPEDCRCRFTGEAVDARGGSLGESAAAAFVVDVTNAVPGAPTFLDPDPGARVAARPAVTLLAGADPDASLSATRSLRIEFDVGSDFASPARQVLVIPAADDPVVAEAPLPLPEDADIAARARTEDERGAASPWVVLPLLVDGVASPPSAPRVTAPGDGEVVAGDGLAVRWAPAVDPEGLPLRYAVEVLDADGVVLAGAGDLLVADGALEGEVALDVTLPPGAYRVRARATDVGDLSGPFGPANRVVVLPPTGSPADLTPYPDACVATVGQRTPAHKAGTALLALVLGAWRRRRAPGPEASRAPGPRTSR